MLHQEAVYDDATRSFDFNQLFDTSASKNRCTVKCQPTVTGGNTASVNGGARKIPKRGTGSVKNSVPEQIHLERNGSHETDRPDEDDASCDTDQDFDEKVRNIVDEKIGNDLETYVRKKFVKSIRDRITKSQKEGLERFKGDGLPGLNVIKGNTQDTINKTVQFRMEYENQKAQERRFQQFVVEKLLGHMNGTVEALGHYILGKLGSNDGLDESSLGDILGSDPYERGN
ncbi:hypothetical protein SEMRO_1781_G297120.1 [Seminavis robusta]|uniref:Uncharacterized protein n=1 Tax=Seminavis robusta TaxID=568900 RepID=A0A9N8HVC4_9STRA|nr:hypothetical protein SEMRO_1781_G297120.1 [Seminavis robusta]|eukprot:Sro1781_g297120.1 n/a (229) ;mRNA; f:17695-18381